MAYPISPVALVFIPGLLAIAAEPPPDAMAIMKKVAENTDAATESRRLYVYHQRVRSSLMRSNGQLVCREAREYTVIPQEKTTEKKLASFSGECREGKQMVPYSAPANSRPGLREKGTGAETNGDRESIASLINDLASDPNSRDGIPRQLFPLRGEELPSYKFTLKGETAIKGRMAYDITFEPAWQKGVCIDVGPDDKPDIVFHADLGTDEKPPGPVHCRPWKGEVWVDAEDYQPVRVDTQLAKSIPWGIRVFMGIDVHQLGFSLTYQRVAKDVWFPATYGTEFRIKVFWGYQRTITMSMENSNFRKTDAESTVKFEGPDQ